MKYIVVLLIVSVLVAEMTHAQELHFDGAINGSVTGSIEIAGHRMNFTGEVRPKREAIAKNGAGPADGNEKRSMANKSRKARR